MDIKGKVLQLLPLQTGEGKNGTWRKQEFVIETEGQYPKKVCISAWGDKINESALQPGKEINVSFDIESREYNGRWYTDVKAWRIEEISANTIAENSAQASAPAAARPTTPLPDTLQADDSDSLPF
ncbi:MAG: DUF3127 domain-containing protein [Runella sp.]